MNRTCKCDGISIQDELHVLKNCPLTANIRSSYNLTVTNLNDFFNLDNFTVINVIYEILSLYNNT